MIITSPLNASFEADFFPPKFRATGLERSQVFTLAMVGISAVVGLGFLSLAVRRRDCLC
jgi:hypothetical protein